jgi:3-oxoacyl-[acyl-carrier-protein] synthase III
VLFGVSGSGQTVGTALYTFDDLPDRLRRNSTPARAPARVPARQEVQHFRCAGPVAISSVSALAARGATVDMLRAAGRDCLGRWGKPSEGIDLVVHAGVYRTEFLSEPALAAIAAGVLGINHDDERPTGKRTLAFDLMSGAAGALTACWLVASLIQGGRASCGLVLASEVENNAEVWPGHSLGLKETASALLLEPSTSSEGFLAFGFRTFPEEVEALVSWAGVHEGRAVLKHERVSNLDRLYLECIRVAVEAFLAGEAVAPGDLKLVLPPCRSSGFVEALGGVIGVPQERVVGTAEEKDLFTSSLADTFGRARAEGRLKPGELVLVIEVGSGVQVACALYRG